MVTNLILVMTDFYCVNVCIYPNPEQKFFNISLFHMKFQHTAFSELLS